MRFPSLVTCGIVMIFASIITPTWAADTTVSAADLAQSVLQVRTASYDSLDQYWKNYSYGSAVYVGDGYAITNAHVINGEDDQPTGAYIVCWSTDWRKAPEICSPALLMYSNTDTDLAVLKIDSPLLAATETAPRTAQLAKNPVDVGDALRMVGYPQNGGETVTITEGKVSGQEEKTGLIKLDANVDAGNSGGGVFTPQGEVAGITESASVGYSTLAIAIPASIATKALTQAKIATKPLQIDAAQRYFKTVLATGKTARLGTIETPLLRLRKFNSFNFVLEKDLETDDATTATYVFGNQEAHDTHISIWALSGGGKIQPWMIQNIKDGLEKDYEKVAVLRGTHVGSLMTDALYFAASPRSSDENPNTVMAIGKAGKINFVISGTKKNPQAFRRALALAGVMVRKDSPEWSEIRLGNTVRTALPQDWVYRQYLESDGVHRVLYATIDNQNVVGDIEITSFPDKTFSDVQAYISAHVGSLADNGIQTQWAGVLNNTKTKIPFIRIAWYENGKFAQHSLFVWKNGDGRIMMAMTTFGADSQKIAQKAADIFTAATQQDKPFGLNLGDVKIGTNLVPEQNK